MVLHVLVDVATNTLINTYSSHHPTPPQPNLHTRPRLAVPVLALQPGMSRPALLMWECGVGVRRGVDTDLDCTFGFSSVYIVSVSVSSNLKS